MMGRRWGSLGIALCLAACATDGRTADPLLDGWAMATPGASLRVDGAHAELAWDGHRIGWRVEDATRVESDGSTLVIEHDGLVERLALDGRDLRQSWHFAEPILEARVLRVALEGVVFDHADDAGLHFVTNDGAEVRYTHGRLIDAEGRSVPVAAQWVEGGVELHVPSSPTLRAPLVLDPVIGPERATDAPIAVIARSADALALIPSGPLGSGYRFLYGVDRLRNVELAADLSGEPSPGTPLARLASQAAIGRAGDVFLAAWVEDDGSGPVLYARRFGRAGDPLDAAPLLVDYGDFSGAGMRPSVTSDASGFFLTYTTEFSLFARRVTAAGSLGARILVDDRDCAESSVAFASGRFVVAYTADADADGNLEVLGAEVSPAGVAGVPVVLGDVGERELAPRLSPSGSGLLLAWHATHAVASPYPTDRVYARRIDDDGALGLGPLIEIAGVPAHERDPELTVSDDGATGLVAWSERAAAGAPTRVLAVRLGASGARLDATPSVVGEGFGAVAAAGAGGHLLVWRAPAASIGSPQGRRLRDDGTFVEPAPVPLVASANRQAYPVLAHGGGRYLAVFRDERAPSGIYAVRVDPVLGVLDDPALYLTTGLTTAAVDFEVTFVGDGFQVIYSVDRGPGLAHDLFGTRVGLDGAVDPPRLWHSAPAEQVEPAAAFTDGVVLVSWLDATAGGPGWDVWARRYAPDGTALGAAFQVDGTQRDTVTSVSAGHGVHLVTWHHRVVGSTAEVNHARRYASDGAVLDATPRVLPGTGSHHVVVIPTTAGFLALGTEREETFAATVDPVTGVVAGRTRLTTGFEATEWHGAIATEGAYWGIRSLASGRFELVPVSADGSVPVGLAPTNLDLGPGRLEELTSALGCASTGTPIGGSWAIAYAREVPEAPFATERVYVRLGVTATLANGDPCSDDASCPSGFCTDGVCCASRCGSSTSDCQACSVAAGGGADGVCGPRAAATPCRASTGACDPAEICDGSALLCPSDAVSPDGSACGDDLFCNGAEVCALGVCLGATAPGCDDGDPCTIDGCAEPGGCEHVRASACDDAGASDAGVPETDGGMADAGMADAGMADAGVADGGVPDAGVPVAPAGCGCRLTRRASFPLGEVILGLLVLAAARGRRAERPRRPARGRGAAS